MYSIGVKLSCKREGVFAQHHSKNFSSYKPLFWHPSQASSTPLPPFLFSGLTPITKGPTPHFPHIYSPLSHPFQLYPHTTRVISFNPLPLATTPSQQNARVYSKIVCVISFLVEARGSQQRACNIETEWNQREGEISSLPLPSLSPSCGFLHATLT